MDGLKKIFGSFKGVAFVLLLTAITVLVVTGKATVDQFNDLAKWAFSAVVVARAGEEGMKGMGNGKALEMLKKLAEQAMGKAAPPEKPKPEDEDG